MPEYCLIGERDAHLVLQQHRNGPLHHHHNNNNNPHLNNNNNNINDESLILGVGGGGLNCSAVSIETVQQSTLIGCGRGGGLDNGVGGGGLDLNEVKFCSDGGSVGGFGGGLQPDFCAGCHRPILDRFFLQAVDAVWHMGCLRCSACHIPLDSEPSCFAKNGAIFCRDDYYKQFGGRSCARCGVLIGGSELVMRARDLVFHLACFSCARCQRLLHTGEVYGLRGPLPYCREDLALIEASGGGGGMLAAGSVIAGHLAGPPGSGRGQGGGGIGGGFFTSHPSLARLPGGFYPAAFGQLSKGRSRKKRGDLDSTDDMFDRGHDDYCLNSPPRQKRMRTSFKHHQLRTMKSYFGLNHNPDAKDLKSLAEKTGLSKRVLQVWFQNARAKYRRSLLRQDSQGGSGNNGGKSGGESGDGGGEGGDNDERAEKDDDDDDEKADDDMVEDSPIPSLDGEDEDLEDELLEDDDDLLGSGGGGHHGNHRSMGDSSVASDLSLSPAMPEFNGSLGGQTGTDSDTCVGLDSMSGRMVMTGGGTGGGAGAGAHITSATAALYAAS